jgi:hypothetical protein
MQKPKIWKSHNIVDEIKNYIEGRTDLKSRPPLTIELMKTFPGCENYTDEEAEFVMKSLNELVPILSDLKLSAKIISIDNQQVVNCNGETELLKIAA